MAKAVVLGIAFLSACSSADKQQVTPVQKVIQLMENMLAKGKKEKHEEQVQFAAYKQFCDDTRTEKERDIQEANDKIEVLKADIEKYTATAARLKKEIAEHEADISTWKGDLKAAASVRAIENEDYKTTHQDYSESIDALGRAIEVVKKSARDRQQASLVEVSSLKDLRRIPEDAKASIDAFLLQKGAPNPEAYGYEHSSGGITEMLEKLNDKFIEERTQLEKDEKNSHHAHEMLVQDLTAQLEQANADVTDKTEQRATTLQNKANAEADLEDTTTTRDADKKYLSDLVATCEQKATDFEARQALRAEELVAIQKAIEIISSNSVSGAADKHLPKFIQAGSALAQLRRASSIEKQSSVVSFLRARARNLDSRMLSSLATNVEANPFAKVTKMIKDLIVRLMEEANDEAEHKGWCDTELSTNEQTRKEKTSAVEQLHAEIDQLESSIAKLGEDLTELSKAVSELGKAMAEATKLRGEEKAKNTQTIEDSAEAQAAVAQALTVLKEFYEKAGDATAFVQQQPEAPEIFEKEYKGMQSENGGVVGMLEVIQSDFARLESDTKTAEEVSQKEYDTFMTDSKVDKESKETSIEHKTQKRQDQEQALTVKKADLEGTQKELDAALAYFDKLKPSCVDAGVSYEDRVARRKEEIQSLQEALEILNGKEIA